MKSLAGRDYPRFHMYLKKEGKAVTANIHLDQKKPSYEGSSAHGGDYDSEIIADEARRISTKI